MMNNYLPYPYPVIGNDTDVTGYFTPDMTYSINPIKTTLNISFELTNDYYKNLIKSGRASFVIDVLCSRTYFRKTYTTNNYLIEIKEPSPLLRGKVDVAFYICTKEVLNDYDPLQDGQNSYVENGDIIGVGGNTSFDATKEYDPLKAPIKSIIKIMSSNKKQNDFDVSYDNDEYIIIRIPKDMYDVYSGVRRNASNMLHASLVLPALIDAITAAKSPEFANTSWAHKLNEIYINRNINPDENPLTIAQKILNNPTMRSLNWCDEILNGEN